MSYAWRDPARVTPARLAELEARDRPDTDADRCGSEAVAARKARYAAHRDAGMSVRQAAAAMGISRHTATYYEKTYRATGGTT